MGDCRGAGKASEGPAPAARCSRRRGPGLVLSLCPAGAVGEGQSHWCGDLPRLRGVPGHRYSPFNHPPLCPVETATVCSQVSLPKSDTKFCLTRPPGWNIQEIPKPIRFHFLLALSLSLALQWVGAAWSVAGFQPPPPHVLGLCR